MKFYYYAVLSITYLWGVVVAHRDASMRSMQGLGAGEFSVVIFGSDNIAPGKFCNVNGGEGNEAGTDSFSGDGFENDYAVIGGGLENSAGSRFSTITGGIENFVSRGGKTPTKHNTISGGAGSGISGFISSVITGGTENRMFGSGDGARNACTISGGEVNICSDDADIGVATGGLDNVANNVAAVAFGGADNFVNGQSATSVGGEFNTINGDFSIGLGTDTRVNNHSSMVINLNDRPFALNDDEGDTDVDGQFLVNAKSYSFQIGKNRDDLRFQITDANIQNLIDALENAA